MTYNAQVVADEQVREMTIDHFRQAVYWYTFTVMFVSGNVSKVSPSDRLINETVHHLRFYTDQMAERCWEIRRDIDSLQHARQQLRESLEHYENLTGVSTSLEPVWTYSNSLFLAITIYTTIGTRPTFRLVRLFKLFVQATDLCSRTPPQAGWPLFCTPSAAYRCTWS